MAVDMFLKFGDLKGESQVKGFEDQIQLLSWQWGMTQTGTMHRGSGGGTGRVNVQDLTFEHYLDAATPSLVAACCKGAHFSEATLTLRKAGGSALDYYVIKLTDIIVSAVSTEDDTGEELVKEWVGLNFAAFEVTYQPQDQKGAKRGGAIVKQYDIAKNSGSYLLPRSPAGMNGAAQLEETYKKGNEQFDYVICASTTGRGNDEVLRHSVFGVEMSRVVLHPNGTIDFRITRNRIGLDAAIRSGLQGCVPSPSNALKTFLQKVVPNAWSGDSARLTQVALSDLMNYVGKPIANICTNGFSSSAQNHCAHFVSHALGLRIGMLCGDMTYATRKTGASIRCDELYNGLKFKGPWDKKPAADDGLLIFVLSARNMHGGRMLNVPQKHVGIHFGGQVFNFSNSQHKVVADQSVEAFHNKFKSTYAGNDISLFYGIAP